MATIDPDDVDAIFARMTEDLDLDVASISEVTVSSLTDLELIERFNATKEELHERGEIPHATTQTGRDLQSAYHAYLLELKKRGRM